MNIKMADFLFEEEEKEKEEEEVKGIPIEGNIQSLSKSTIEQVSKYIASTINRKLPNEESVPDNAKDKPLGVIEFKDLKLLSNVPIKGLYVSPGQIKGEQQSGLSQTDFKKYEQQQIVPLFLRNDENENIGSNSKGQEMAAIFYLPAMFCDIEDKNIPIHSQMFDLPRPEKDETYHHIGINSLKYELVKQEDIENIQASFKTGNGKILSKVSMKAKRNIPSGANEKKGESETAQANNESYFSNKTIIIKDKNKRATYDMQKLHKNKLSQLLFESDLNQLHSQDLKENFVYKSGILELLNEEYKSLEGDKRSVENIKKLLQKGLYVKIGYGQQGKHADYIKSISSNNKNFIILSKKDKTEIMSDASKDKLETFLNNAIQAQRTRISSFEKTESDYNSGFVKRIEQNDIYLDGKLLESKVAKKHLQAVILETEKSKADPEQSQVPPDESSQEEIKKIVKFLNDDLEDAVKHIEPLDTGFKEVFAFVKVSSFLTICMTLMNKVLNISEEILISEIETATRLSTFRSNIIKLIHPESAKNAANIEISSLNQEQQYFIVSLRQILDNIKKITKDLHQKNTLFEVFEFDEESKKFKFSKDLFIKALKDANLSLKDKSLDTESIEKLQSSIFNKLLKNVGGEDNMNTTMHKIAKSFEESQESSQESDESSPPIEIRFMGNDKECISVDNTSILSDGSRNPEFRATIWKFENDKWNFEKRIALTGAKDIDSAIKEIEKHNLKPQNAKALLKPEIQKILTDERFNDLSKRLAKQLNIDISKSEDEAPEEQVEDDTEQADQDAGETTQDKKEEGDAADVYLDDGNILYFVNKHPRGTTLFFEFYKKENDKIFNYTLSLNRKFAASNSKQQNFWDEIKKNPYEKGKPNLINQLYKNRNKQGYEINELNNAKVKRDIINIDTPIRDILLLASQTSDKVLEFSQKNESDVKKFYDAVVEFYSKSYASPPNKEEQFQGEEETQSGFQEEDLPQEEENQPQGEQETDLMPKDKWLDNIDPDDWYDKVKDGEYFYSQTDNKNELISLVKIKGKVYYLNGFDLREINIPDLENITSLNKNEIIKERLKEFFENNGVYEIKTGEHIFKPSNKPSEKFVDYISQHHAVKSISKEFKFINLQKDENKSFAKFMKLLNLAASLDDKKDFDKNVDKTYPNLKKYFGDFKDTKGFNDVTNAIKDLYEKNSDFKYEDLKDDSEDSIHKKLDRRIIKDFERKVLNFISKNEKLIFNKLKKTGSDSLSAYTTSVSLDFDKLNQFILYNFIKKQEMFESKFIFQSGISLLLENDSSEEESKMDVIKNIKNNTESLAINLILGLVNHAVNNDMIDYSWKPESDREGKVMSSKVLAKRIKKANNLSDSNEISEEMIRSMLISDLKNICLGVVEKYDPERYEIMLNKADRSILKDEREETSTSDKVKAGIATAGTVAAVGTVAAITAGAAAIIPSIFAGAAPLGAAVTAALGAAGSAATTAGLGTSALSAAAAHEFSLYSFFKKKIQSKKSDQEIADRLVKREGAEHVITRRENIIYGLLEKEIDELIDLIFVLVKEDKGIVEENKNLFLGSLSRLLFEADESGEEISVQDIKDYLKSSGILIYNKDSRVSGKDLAIAEKELIGSIAAIFKSHFGVNVKGSAGYKKLDTSKVEVASTVNQNAEKGQPASEQISNMTAGVGIPMGMNAPFNMNQMAAMINMMGGNPMMSFMMMMMNPQFMQQMMQMQKQGATFGEASKVVAEKAEISDFEKLLEEVIENQRASLPSISRKDAIKVIKLCKNIYGAFNDIGTNLSGVTFDPDKKKAILFEIQNTINIVKEDQEITDDALSELIAFVINQFAYDIKLKDFVEQKADKACNIFDEDDKKTELKKVIKHDLSYYMIDKFIKNLFNKESSIKSLYKHFHKETIEYLEHYYKFTDDQKEILTNCLNEIQKHIDDKVDFDVSKITAENKLIRNKSIIRRRSIRKNKIINESEFLKSELKRLWKL